MHRVGQDRIYTPYMTVYCVVSLPRILYIQRTYMVLANPTFADRVLCHHTGRTWTPGNNQDHGKETLLRSSGN